MPGLEAQQWKSTNRSARRDSVTQRAADRRSSRPAPIPRRSIQRDDSRNKMEALTAARAKNGTERPSETWVRTRAHTVAATKEGKRALPKKGNIEVPFGGRRLQVDIERSTLIEVGMHRLRWRDLSVIHLTLTTENHLKALDSQQRVKISEALGRITRDLARSDAPQLGWNVTAENFANNSTLRLVATCVLSYGDDDAATWWSNERWTQAAEQLSKELRTKLDGRQNLDETIAQLNYTQWSVELIRMPDGSCNLYKYPRIIFPKIDDDAASQGSRPPDTRSSSASHSGTNGQYNKLRDDDEEGRKETIILLNNNDPRILALDGLILAIAANDKARDKFFNPPDSVGARAIHGLLVSNTTASLKLAIKLFEQDFADDLHGNDWLMMQVHGPPDGVTHIKADVDEGGHQDKIKMQNLDKTIYDPDKLGLFIGETCFHVVAANEKEEE